MIRDIFTAIGGTAVICGISFLAGAHWQSDQYKAAYERQVAALQAANSATETDKERLANKLQQSEQQIAKWEKDYNDAITKNGEAACLFTDADLRWLRLDPKAARPKPPAKRRL